MQVEKLLTADLAAKHLAKLGLSVKPKTILKWRRIHRLKGFAVGKIVLFRPEDLDNFILKNVK